MSRTLVKRVLTLVGFCGLIVPGAWADEYEEPFADSDWTGGTHENHTSDPAPPWPLILEAQSDCDVADGRLRVRTAATGVGTATAKAEAWLDFAYASDHTYMNGIEVRYTVFGQMDYEVFSSNHLIVRVELWDVTDPNPELHEKLHTETDVDKEDTDWEMSEAETRLVTFWEALEAGHRYQVKLVVEAECDLETGGTQTSVDFFDDGAGYGVDWVSLRIHHTHHQTTTAGGSQTGYRAVANFNPVQSAYGAADQLSFVAYNTAVDINGWEVLVQEFTRSASDRVEGSQRDIDVTADSPEEEPVIVPEDFTVLVKQTQWLATSSICSNTIEMKDTMWNEYPMGRAGGSRQAKAVPDHGWRVRHPAPVPGVPGFFAHPFELINNDTQALKVCALGFQSSMTFYDTLGVLEWEGPLYEFTLMPGEMFTMDVITEGPLIGGWIYFKYSVFDESGAAVICTARGGHEVSGIPGDVDRDGDVDLADYQIFALGFTGPQ